MVLLAACSGVANPRLSRPVRQWAEGPVRWLLLPAEERELRRLRSDSEAAVFVAEFWRRRDPDPTLPGNRARELFEQRVTAADRQYPEQGQRGSLTDRGRALVVLGPPSLLRVGRRTSPAWAPTRASTGPMPVRHLVIETWEYRPQDLPPRLAERLAGRGEDGITLTFVLGEHTRLLEGEEALLLAAESAVRLPD